MMKSLVGTLLAAAACAAIGFISCSDTATGPNDIGGETNLDLTQVGNTFSAYLDVTNEVIPGLDHMNDSIVITKNDNGIVTTHVLVGFDTAFVSGLDSALGTKSLPWSAKLAILDTYLDRYGATIDTTNKLAMKVNFDLKMKVTSEGIQEFVHSKGDLSRPFTIVKYGAAVGDKYQFVRDDGVTVTRTVTYKSATDDYPLGFWQIKVIKVEESASDPLMEKVTYYTNHKFGLVGVVFLTKNGRELKIGIFPPNL
jgi:hypothetical protein